jgi:hypothetical protein
MRADNPSIETANTIRAALAWRRITYRQAWEAVGIPERTWVRKMKRGPWTVDEIAAVADFLGVAPGHLVPNGASRVPGVVPLGVVS